MDKQLPIDHFIGRTQEMDRFTRWLTDPNAPWILYIHDAAEEAEKKGGVGKTWLLRRCADLTKQIRQDTTIVMIDFFNVGDRDRVFLAKKIIAGLQELYPAWTPESFNRAIQQYSVEKHQTASGSGSSESADTKIRDEVSVALKDDLRRLDTYLVKDQKTLLVFLDTFEAIETNPDVAVLRRSQVFPDNYQFERMRVVMAGRNRLDWTHPNWEEREQEVQIMPLAPFNQEEMLEYFRIESIDISSQNGQVRALYERTEGRPIIIGLAIDVLSYRILTVDDLIAVSRSQFESYLVPQVNKLENPLNWVILFMAHVYHHFNMSILEWILHRVELSEPVQLISPERLSKVLPTLSFVRRSGSGDDFVLHDEMRRLVTRYCWEILDTDQRFRKDISRNIIRYYDREMSQFLNEQQRQRYIIEALYHRLFVNLNDGLIYFQQQFQSAISLFKTAFTRLLLQEVKKFTDLLSLAQYNDVQLAEVKLLRNEDNLAAALDLLQQIRCKADLQWYEEHQPDVLLEEGRCYRGQSKLADATDSFAQCLAIQQARGNELQSANLLYSLGLVSRRRGQFSEALDYYDQSIALYKKLGQQIDYANTLTNISMVYRLQGKIEEALRRCKIAWRIRLELFQMGKTSEVQVGLSLHSLGQIYLSAGNISEADRCFHEAFDIFQRVNYKVGIARVYNRYGQVQLVKGELESAQNWFIKAQESSHEIETEQYINSLNKQGRINAQQHNWEAAVTLFERAIAAAEPVPDYYQQTESLIDLAYALEHLNQVEHAQKNLQEAEDIAKRENYFYLLGLIEQTRGEIYHRAKNYSVAFQHFVLYCHHMADYNFSEFTMAVQKVVDALLDVPKDNVSAIVKELLTYWRTHGLEKDYPELIQAFEEVDDFMIL